MAKKRKMRNGRMIKAEFRNMNALLGHIFCELILCNVEADDFGLGGDGWFYVYSDRKMYNPINHTLSATKQGVNDCNFIDVVCHVSIAGDCIMVIPYPLEDNHFSVCISDPNFDPDDIIMSVLFLHASFEERQ